LFIYRKWIQSKKPNDEIRYKKYRNIFRKVADAAEKSFYKNMFDVNSNSVRQLCNNLNAAFNCKCNKSEICNISKLIIINQSVTSAVDISNALNTYFFHSRGDVSKLSFQTSFYTKKFSIVLWSITWEQYVL
jgi:hypothetical protein